MLPLCAFTFHLPVAFCSTSFSLPTLEKHTENTDSKAPKTSDSKKHFIKSPWLRIPAKVLMWLCIIVLVLPVIVYIPPVQTLLKNVACKVASDATGMKIDIQRFRLEFPLDVALDGVQVIEASGDTMVSAKTAVADVKLLPLLKKDIKLNALRLQEGYYRLISADSSMIMKIRAGLLDVDGRSSFDLKSMHLDINKAHLRDGDIQMYSNVWKKKPNPDDTTQTQMLITAHKLLLENVSFAMSMLPTIDTLSFSAKKLQLINGNIDLTNSKIAAELLDADNGNFTYITPTPEWVKAHPAPIDTISPPSPPFTIQADSVALNNFNVLYATKGAKPMPGFDAAYISLSGVSASVKDFYNQQTSLRVPITRLMAKERSGLQILQGSGLMTLDSLGMAFQDLQIKTPFSNINASASIPFAFMEMKPTAPFSVKADGSVAFADINAFMPSLAQYTKMLSPAQKVLLGLDAAGTLASINVRRLYADIPDIFNLNARGAIDNPLNIKLAKGNLNFDASLRSPAVAQRMARISDISIPSFNIIGKAKIDRDTYSADFDMRTSAGNLAANGSVSLNSEGYYADITASALNVAHIMPSLGLGQISAHIKADGHGFDPTRPGAATDLALNISSLLYDKHNYRDINGTIGLHGGQYTVDLTSADPDANFDILGSGTVAPDNYSVDMRGRISHLDLQALGFSETTCNGTTDFYINGSAQPGKWLYDITAKVDNLQWNLPDQFIDIPDGVDLSLIATPSNVDGSIMAQGLDFKITGDVGLESLISKLSATTSAVQAQINEKHLDVDVLQKIMPQFTMDAHVSGKGLPGRLLNYMGYRMDTLSMNIQNIDSLISGNIDLLGLNTGSMTIDTLGLGLKQRGSLLNYSINMGNRPGNLPEFAKVTVNGYMGGNRLSAFLRQKNEKGETGYRLGFTAALQDSTVTLRFTPLKATIAYMPWTFNTDNYIDYTLGKKNPLNANLMASSSASSILLKTENDEDGQVQQHLNLNNIHIQDFLGMDITNDIPMTATVNADLVLRFRENALMGQGSALISDFSYDGTNIDPISADFNAGLDFAGDTKAHVSLKINNQEALVISGLMKNDGSNVNEFAVDLTDFPLSVANAFLPKDMAQLEGSLAGHMSMDGDFTQPKLNGQISFNKAAVIIPMMGSKLHFAGHPVTVENNLITFSDFNIKGQNDNPLTINGSVDASKFTNIITNLKLNAQNFQLVGNNANSPSDIYGKLFLTLGATCVGPINQLDINGNLSVLSNTDVFYTMSTTASDLTAQDADEVVRFVSFNDTTLIAKEDTLTQGSAMRIRAALTIQPGAKVTVNLASLTGSGKAGKIVVNPSGTLNYYQNWMGDMTLNGIINLGQGSAKYSLPIVGEKSFDLSQGSFVQFNGDIANPAFNLTLTDQMKVNINDNGNYRLVPFLISLAVSGNLNQPKILFDLDAEGDMTIENELSSMTADQRSQQAMNLLLYGQYTGANTKTAGANFGESALYGFLTSQINSWAANHVKGVDLSFGINQFDQTSNGNTSSAMSYSYQVSKSLLNNKFKIVVGGNYTTNQNADENFAENLLSDVSFEYLLKQTNNLTMLVKLFRQYNYESVLEGQISEMGVGFVMKRRLSDLRRFFHVRWGKRKNNQQPLPSPADSTIVDSLPLTKPREINTSLPSEK